MVVINLHFIGWFTCQFGW